MIRAVKDHGMAEEGQFERSEALLGAAAMRRLANLKVAVFGAGGVGGACAEALVRTGLMHLEVVDFDVVAPSNMNRQVQACPATVGRPKAEALCERLLSVSPSARLTWRNERYSASSGAFDFGACDVVVDAIDSVADKAALVREALAAGAMVYSSMGAALRTDPTQVRVSKFSKVSGDGLARALRQRFRKDGLGTPPDFLCVHSCELPRDIPVRGSVMQVTAAFGLALASLVTSPPVPKCRRVGVFGGSFNPVHSGHLRIALQAIEDCRLDLVYVLPAKKNPFKTVLFDAGAAAEAERLGFADDVRWRLVKRACAGHPRLVPCGIDLARGGVSFAIDTVREIGAMHPGAEIFWIMGEDAAEGLPKWKDFDELRRLCRFKAYPRTPESSTEVRRRLAAGESTAGLVPECVREELERLFGGRGGR